MIRRLALVSIGATALVLAMAAATQAGEHNTPPTVSPAPVAQIQAAPVIVSNPVAALVVELRATPATNAILITPAVPLAERSTRALPTVKPTDATPNRLPARSHLRTRHGSIAAIDENGGRGFFS